MIRDPSDGSVRKQRKRLDYSPLPPDPEVAREAEKRRAREEQSREWLRQYRLSRLSSNQVAD